MPISGYEFESFELDLKRYELRRDGQALKLEKIPMELLILLVSRNGYLVSREEIVETLWGKDVFVETEHGINTAVRKARQALGDDPENPRFVKTVVGKGYRFTAPISVRKDEPAATIETGQAGPPPAPTSYRLLWILGLGFGIMAAALASNIGGLRDLLVGHTPPAQVSSLAVIPLVNLSGDKNEEYFADGMTDELITDLAKNSNLRVISRTSVIRYKNTRKQLPDIGKELGVDAIIEGTIQRSGNRVKVRAQLIRCADDRHLWADTFERDMPDVLALQSEVASSIARQVQMNLLSGRPPSRTINPAAYEAYLRGRYAWNRRSEANLQEGIQYFQQAIALEPTYAEAYSGMADSYAALGYLSYLSPKEAFSQARAAAEKAISFDPSLPEAHASLAYVHFYYEWNWTAAESEFRKAIALNPNYAIAHDYYSYFLLATQRFDEARHEIDQALRLDPLSLPINTDVAFQMFYRGRYDDAIVQLKKALEMNPKYPLAHLWLGRCYQQKGMYEQSFSEYQATSDALPDWVVTIAGIGNLQALSGKTADAHQTLTRLAAMSRQKYVTPYGIALVYAGMSDKDQVFRYLDKAYDDRANWLVWLRFDPRWDGIRSDPRYADLVHRIGFPES